MVVMVVMTIVYFIAYAVALGATTVAVSELYMGRPVTIRGRLRAAARQDRPADPAPDAARPAVRGCSCCCSSWSASPAGLGTGFRSSRACCCHRAARRCSRCGSGWRCAIRSRFRRWCSRTEGESLDPAQHRADARQRVPRLRAAAVHVIVTYAVLAIVQGPFLFAIMMAGPESSTAFVLNLCGTSPARSAARSRPR